MSILIKDMEMPEHCGYCRFRYDGICHALQKTQYATTDCPLVSVPVQPETKEIHKMTSDLISREDAIMALNEVSEHYTGKGRNWHPHVNFMIEAIKELPSAERRGKWTIVDRRSTIYMYHCSICGAHHRARYDYCPSCGARMD